MPLAEDSKTKSDVKILTYASGVVSVFEIVMFSLTIGSYDTIIEISEHEKVHMEDQKSGYQFAAINGLAASVLNIMACFSVFYAIEQENKLMLLPSFFTNGFEVVSPISVFFSVLKGWYKAFPILFIKAIRIAAIVKLWCLYKEMDLIRPIMQL